MQSSALQVDRSHDEHVMRPGGPILFCRVRIKVKSSADNKRNIGRLAHMYVHGPVWPPLAR